MVPNMIANFLHHEKTQKKKLVFDGVIWLQQSQQYYRKIAHQLGVVHVLCTCLITFVYFEMNRIFILFCPLSFGSKLKHEEQSYLLFSMIEYIKNNKQKI